MVDRIHRNTTNCGPDSLPAFAACLANRNVFVVQIPHLANRSNTIDMQTPDLTRREQDLGVVAFLGHHLRTAASTPDKLSAFARTKLKVMNRGPKRNVL